MKNIKNLILIILAIIITMIVVRKCESPKIVTKVKTEIKYITDTINNLEISKPKIVYINDTIYKKGEKVSDTIYITKVKANEYDTTIESDSASSDLKITTTGELISVKGNITYPKKTKTIEVTKTRSRSGLFLYGAVPFENTIKLPEIGLIYQFKNTLGVMGGVEYNNVTNSVNAKIGLLVRVY